MSKVTCAATESTYQYCKEETSLKWMRLVENQLKLASTARGTRSYNLLVLSSSCLLEHTGCRGKVPSCK